ncbi:hypothetical protein [Candidatus Methylacidithermus pantelleriae]|uniref:Uncharacterized protein n=1 Tax=Candidatus Methylacidithermus pantelleriae TaxID=2744239 RepID=A0A8J2BW79_9BACT|nr:hypothetical protein [Candidatus Methylacidithermus pantelleriae]CAF0705388.1 hypothetical protein MPNT_90081 [Candidatus Methylacidithermus pantelleriae]
MGNRVRPRPARRADPAGPETDCDWGWVDPRFLRQWARVLEELIE